MRISRLGDGPEIFFTIQGEGPTVGTPSVFVRSALCNLHCVWCDTDYTWNWEGTPFQHVKDQDPEYRKYSREEQVIVLQPREIADAVLQFGCENLVMTGGEPLLQQKGWIEVMEILRGETSRYRFEVETNGTLAPDSRFDALMSHYNVSPKLSNAGMSRSLRIKEEPLRIFASSPKAVFKFVVDKLTDLEEIRELVEDYGIGPDRVWLMPQGTTTEQLDSRARWLVEACKRSGFRYSDRLQVRLYGDRRGF